MPQNTSEQIRSVFIVEDDSQGWIINHLIRDIAAELEARGMVARIGKASSYGAEDVIFNSRFLTPLHSPRARVNSLFITHIDDRIKELELRSTFTRFNSFVCLSPHDAEFVSALKSSGAGVVGIELPPRDQRVSPVRLAYFSARYEDGRKNERWIIEYFQGKTREERHAFILSFLGWGWEGFGAQLAELDMNFEIVRYSRFLAGEYGLYKRILESSDALIYAGFDGGAMSVYDAISAGIRVIASDTSYHRGLGGDVTLFGDREQFFAALDEMGNSHAGRTRVLGQRSISNYVNQLLEHWNGVAAADHVEGAAADPEASALPSVVQNKTIDEFRSHYKPMRLGRIRSALIRWVTTRIGRT